MTGGVITGDISVPAPSVDEHAATKKYVDDQDDLKLNLTGGRLTGALSSKSGGATLSAYKVVNQNDDKVALKMWCPGGAGSQMKYVGNNNTDHWFQLYDDTDKNPVTTAKFGYGEYNFLANTNITYSASDAHYFAGKINFEGEIRFNGGDNTDNLSIYPNVGNDDSAITALNKSALRFRTASANDRDTGKKTHMSIEQDDAGVPTTRIYHLATPTSANDAVNKSYVDAFASGVPTGTVVMWLGTNAPDGWLICDGSDFDITAYPELHTHLGTVYNYTTGKTPDFRGLYPGGAGFAHNNQLTSGSANRPNVYFSQRTAQPNGGPPTSNSSRPTGNVRTFASTGNTNAYSDGISQVSISRGWDNVTRPPTLSVHFIIKT